MKTDLEQMTDIIRNKMKRVPNSRRFSINPPDLRPQSHLKLSPLSVAAAEKSKTEHIL